VNVLTAVIAILRQNQEQCEEFTEHQYFAINSQWEDWD